MSYKYHGYTYPAILSRGPIGWLWKRFCCPMGWHLWDEVLGTGGAAESGWEHYMVCDVCGEEIQLILVKE